MDGNLATTYSLVYAFLLKHSHTKVAQALKKAAKDFVILTDDCIPEGPQLDEIIKLWKSRELTVKEESYEDSSSSSSEEEDSYPLVLSESEKLVQKSKIPPTKERREMSDSYPSIPSASDDESSDSESSASDKNLKKKTTTKRNSTRTLSSNNRSSRASESDSDAPPKKQSKRTAPSDETSLKAKKKRKAVKKQEDTSSSSEESDSSSDSNSSDEDSGAQRKRIGLKTADDDSSSDAPTALNTKGNKTKSSYLSKSTSSVVNSEETRFNKKRRTDVEGNSVAMTANPYSKRQQWQATKTQQRGANNRFMRVANNRFMRVDPSKVQTVADNSYVAKVAPTNDYGKWAHEDLIDTRGAGFRKEKNKKKRGSYRGGEITMESHSFKFT